MYVFMYVFIKISLVKKIYYFEMRNKWVNRRFRVLTIYKKFCYADVEIPFGIGICVGIDIWNYYNRIGHVLLY